MNTKEYFLEVLKQEKSKFRASIEALPEEKHKHKVHDKSREAGNLAAQLALQWKAISGVLNSGTPTMNPHDMENQSKADMLAKFDEGYTQLEKDVAAISQEEWDNGEANMGDMWKTKKYDMAWGFLFDAIHHRGQLSTFLRAMGEKVPSIYGPSADSQGE
jgi:uncharacterized damage-inducible protein DinB